MANFVDYAADLRTLAQCSDPSAVLRTALDSLREVLTYDLAVAYAPDGPRLTACAANGPLADERVRAHAFLPTDFAQIARAVDERQTVVLSDCEPYGALTPRPPGRTSIVVPLFDGDRRLGLIVLMRPAEAAPSAELAGAYGRIVSLAIVAAEEAEQLREENRRLKQQRGDTLPDFTHMQRDYFRRVLERTQGRIYGRRGAAELVGLKPTTLQSRLKKLGIDPALLRRH